MSEEFTVDAHRLAGSGRLLAIAADQLADEIGRLEAELASVGAVWGDDDLGSLIGLAYQEIRDVAVDCLQGNVADLKGHAEAVQAMASAYQDSDDHAAALFDADRG